MQERIAEIQAQYAELTAQLGDPDIASDPKAYRQIVTTQKQLAPIALLAEEQGSLLEQKEDAELLAQDDDTELVEMANLELETINARLKALADALQLGRLLSVVAVANTKLPAVVLAPNVDFPQA